MKHMKWSLLYAIGAVLAVVLAGAPHLVAQSNTEGAIGGLVSDQSKGVLPGGAGGDRGGACSLAINKRGRGPGRLGCSRNPLKH